MPEPGRMSDDPDDQPVGEADRDVTAFRRLAEATQARLSPVRQWLARYEHLPVVDVIAGVLNRRDRESAGPVMGSAIAFRLFLFSCPCCSWWSASPGSPLTSLMPATSAGLTGIYGSLGAEISEAFHQPGFTRWFAVLIGLFGVLTAGRSLSRVLRAASAAAWRLPLSGSRASLRAAGLVAGPDLRHGRDRYSREPGAGRPGTGRCGARVCPGPGDLRAGVAGRVDDAAACHR